MMILPISQRGGGDYPGVRLEVSSNELIELANKAEKILRWERIAVKMGCELERCTKQVQNTRMDILRLVSCRQEMGAAILQEQSPLSMDEVNDLATNLRLTDEQRLLLQDRVMLKAFKVSAYRALEQKIVEKLQNQTRQYKRLKLAQENVRNSLSHVQDQIKTLRAAQ
jgi:hypothetical protein